MSYKHSHKLSRTTEFPIPEVIKNTGVLQVPHTESTSQRAQIHARVLSEPPFHFVLVWDQANIAVC